MLLPSPRTSDTNGAGHHGEGGLDLRTAVAEIGALCDGCNVHEPWEHRCHGEPCACLECREERRNAGDAGRTDARMADRGQPLSEVAVNVLMPTPRATDGTKGTQRGSSGDLMLPSAVQLLPTPTATDSKSSGSAGYTTGHDGTTLTDATVRQPARWGEYEPAIRRWEALTRPAPEPTKPNAKGNPKLSDEFDEWLMGMPAGWITDAPGVTWNEALKACGNGVVWQQAAAAIRWLIAMGTAA